MSSAAITSSQAVFLFADHSFRQAADLEAVARPRQETSTDTVLPHDLRKLRGKGLADKPGRSRRYHIPPEAARTIAALLALHDHVIGPILAGVRSPRMGRKPKIWTGVDRRYESLRIGMQDLFHDLGIAAAAA